uniref:Uncharacterized protein n=1 Tax=Oryza sativa subsp. japonica TaxID=39947 RepID=Q6YYI8_ORYSJ|nr:hypothetical protein [Oryza sativa Japonica Group]
MDDGNATDVQIGAATAVRPDASVRSDQRLNSEKTKEKKCQKQLKNLIHRRPLLPGKINLVAF